ncbi:hypothetical protein [Thermophilibacter mediterraneus]|uniref:hypothetical protein n=1 Tax=Thermophilibacter mediterraneus TaxID=1871031 RepID=UPI002354658F|nr:hypothetical protein [Thermophilibacter mediterraneus]
MRRRLFATLMLAAGMLFAAPAAALADGITMNGTPTAGSITVDEGTNTITVSGNATMSGNGDAFTINANTTLEFDPGATLTLTGYTNAFVVSNATLSGGGWNITDGDGMDLFRLKTGGKLSIDDDVTLAGNGTDAATDTAAASRAIVLESGSGQEVALVDGATLAASNFYRGMETGGASGYTISGQNRETSIFDFSDNDCGMALSYFDSNATYKNCKLEVSDCLTSGIFMRQDNAALAGLVIDDVWINCENDENLNQADIAIRFHSNDFTIQDSRINIQNAWNTGLWIYDGWNANPQNEIINTEITVNHVDENDSLTSLLGFTRRKAITFVPYRDWLVSGSTITINDTGEGGINVASDPQINRNGSLFPNAWTATLGMRGGKVIFEDTTINSTGVIGADLGAQVGQWIEIGKNTVINNGNSNEHYTILCDDASLGFPASTILGDMLIPYDEDILTENDLNPNRVIVTGGSFWSSQRTDIVYEGISVYEQSIPSLNDQEKLHMVTLTPEQYASYAINGVLTVKKSDESTYTYEVKNASADGNRYIWIPNGASLVSPTA